MSLATYRKFAPGALTERDIDDDIIHLATACQSSINQDYVYDCILNNEQLAFVLVAVSESHELLAFVVASVKESGARRKYGFINLLCSSLQSREKKEENRSSGKDLLERAEYELAQLGVDTVSLHAVEEARAFYEKNGYRYNTPETARLRDRPRMPVYAGSEVVMTKQLPPVVSYLRSRVDRLEAYLESYL